MTDLEGVNLKRILNNCYNTYLKKLFFLNVTNILK